MMLCRLTQSVRYDVVTLYTVVSLPDMMLYRLTQFACYDAPPYTVYLL